MTYSFRRSSVIQRQEFYTIKLLSETQNYSTFVIRENDNYGEYPNIFAKVYYSASHTPTAVILSDSGTGLHSKNGQNIATFLADTINPHHVTPYTILTTHCHYDHICGIQSLLDTKAKFTVLSSSHDLSYLTPWKNLQKHSLCEDIGLIAPRYDARWVDDGQTVLYSDGYQIQESSIKVLHIPGHTPDSMAWYDRDTLTLCVGDTFYEKESDTTRSGSDGNWSREPPQPVIFTDDSSIMDWNASMHRLLDFVRAENRRLANVEIVQNGSTERQDGMGVLLGFDTTTDHDDDEWTIIEPQQARKRVVLSASHVTMATDAETALLDMLNFMFRIQLDQVPRRRVKSSRGRTDTWFWDDCPATDGTYDSGSHCRFSVRAPWSFVYGSGKR